LGHHYDQTFDKTRHLCVILWEVPGERIDIKDKDSGVEKNLPRAKSKQYTLSLNEKANLRKDLESWRGKPFTAEQIDGFDIKAVLGQSCQLQIIHKPSPDGSKTYANISSIVQAPPGEKPNPENELQYFSFEDKMEIPANTPKWIRETIERSDEYRHLNNANKIEPPISEPHSSDTQDISGIRTSDIPPPDDGSDLPF